jgi:hypothetical protein
MDSQEIELSRLELTRLCRTRADGPLPGDSCPCPGCGGRIGVHTTRKLGGGWRVRYLHCKACRFTPENNKWLTAEDFDESPTP